ncbi:hypothetical protein K504DRAFT_448846 [Pleomassaria siparia CBS 279.74]|uniref:Uncharacterized protein n=1 Tax=Pleomassaria siparia CBS 279.74 TaxID=1314801 RepID=A0A6G1JYD9_9PLEO|nr:hypothetical protein K504DRAFT_448846 [Pleomassaria siparia CBS 279.74]
MATTTPDNRDQRDHPPTTLLAAFDNYLPEIDPGRLPIYDITKDTGEALLEKRKAHGYLQDRVSRVTSPTLNNEVDVGSCAQKYLTEHINQVLMIEYGPQVMTSAQLTGEGDTQVDLIWRHGKEAKPVAILEFRRPGSLRYEDLRPALVYSEEELDGKLTGEFLLKDNGLTFGKQVAAYAITHNTPFLALFDWNSMVLFEFNKLNVHVGDPGQEKSVGEWGYGT